jgi:D-glycero-D-manno-heptose 1,7-bisphosphate phosphatase
VKPAVFLDRDGVIVEEAAYLDRLERLVFFPFSIDAVRLLNHAGLATVVITNQSGIGRGLYDEAFVLRTHEVMTQKLAAGGARIDRYYYCPHHRDAVIERYRVECDCRKPAAGMLRQAASELQLDLTRSFVVGDKWTDVRAADAAGAKGILVRTGYGRSSELTPPDDIRPTRVVDNLIAAVSWILREP